MPTYGPLTITVTDSTSTVAELGPFYIEVGASTLNALGGTFSLPEDAAENAIAGGISGVTAGSVLTLLDNAGGRVALSGNNVVRGSTILDYETNTSHNFTVRETLAGSSNSPRDTVLSLSVTNIDESSAPITTVAADGFTAIYDGVPSVTTLGGTIEEEFTVTRQGFNSSGAATTFTETIRVATPKRAAGTVTYDTGKVALSSYVMADDSIVGCTNNSTMVSPAPVVRCVTYDRVTITDTVGGTVAPVEIFADHWSGIACVKFFIAKGGTTLSEVVVSTPAFSTAGSNLDGLVVWDRSPLPVYALPATSVAALTGDGMVTVDYEVYPRVGVAVSVFKSADLTTAGGTRREPTTRYFDKRARGAAYAYVDTSATDDTTGVWSNNPATAAASPFKTSAGADNVLSHATRGLPATGGVVDGCRKRFRAGTHTMSGPSSGLTQNVGGYVLERDPDTTTTASEVLLNFANASYGPRMTTGFTSPLSRGWIIFREVTLTRTGAVGSIRGESTGPVFLTTVLDNCRLDFGAGFGGNTFFAATGGINFHAHYGTQFINFTNGGMAYNAGNQTQILRGVDLTAASLLQGECYATVASRLLGTLSTFNTSDPTKGFVFYGNQVRSTAAAVLLDLSAANGATMGGAVLAHNIFEIVHATDSAAGIGIGQNTGSTSHTLVYNNSATGWAGTGRWNLAYDRFGGSATIKQDHPFFLFQGNIVPQLNTKGDKWKLDQGTPNPEIYTGDIAFDHGVLCEGNIMVFNTSAGLGSAGPLGTENQTYMGRNCFRNSGTNSHYVQNSAYEWEDIYVTYGGTGDNGSNARQAGPGNTVFTLESASPAKNRLLAPRLTKDIAATNRANPDSAGAYA